VRFPRGRVIAPAIVPLPDRSAERGPDRAQAAAARKTGTS
jgi:hypothetical protein